MSKQIIKQIFIIILSCIAIVLVMALVFYQYIPSNKVMPSKVQAYSTPESVKTEIEEKANGDELVGHNEMYEVTDSDLDMYKSTKSYNPGKSDPFATFSEDSGESSSSTPATKNASSSNSGDSSGSGSSSDRNQGGSSVDRNTTDNYYTAANVSKGTK